MLTAVWPRMSRDIRQFVETCHECQSSEVQRHTRAPFQSFELPPARFRHIHVDLVGPLPPSEENKYVLTIVDRYSRWPEVFPIPEQTQVVARALYEQWICRYGCPDQIMTDQAGSLSLTFSRSYANATALGESEHAYTFHNQMDWSSGFTVL